MTRLAILARLGGVLALCVAAEVLLLETGGGTESPPPVRPAPAVAPAAAGRTAPDVAELAAVVLARPVFSATRRPAAEAAAPAASSGRPAALPRLTGILISERTKTAIFSGGSDGKALAVGERGNVGGYTVQSIEADRATVSGPEGVRVLRPSFDPNASAAPATTAPAQPPAFFPQGAVQSQAAVPGQRPGPGQPSVLDLLRNAAPRVAIPGLNPLPQAPEQ